MSKYRKLPVVVEAVQYTFIMAQDVIDGKLTPWGLVPQMSTDEDGCSRYTGRLRIPTLEGGMLASPGDWIITGVQGERYPCKPDIFEETYEPVSVEAKPAPQDQPLNLKTVLAELEARLLLRECTGEAYVVHELISWIDCGPKMRQELRALGLEWSE